MGTVAITLNREQLEMLDFALGNAIDLAQVVSLKASPPTSYCSAMRGPTLTQLVQAEQLSEEDCRLASQYLASFRALRDNLISDALARCPVTPAR
jgi:hypothetical protein